MDLEVNCTGEKCEIFGRTVHKTEGKLYANALRWEWASHIWGRAKRATWLEPRVEMTRGVGSGNIMWGLQLPSFQIGIFQIGKGVCQGCMLSPCLFKLYAEYIMRNAGLDEAQAEIKIARRNINNLRYADDTTLMAESEEELKSLLMKVKEESEKAGLKLNVQKMKIMSYSHHFMANRWGNSWNSDRLYFIGLQNHCRWWLQPWH